MEKKKKNILVYTDNTVKCYAKLTIQVDDSGDEWLTPGQIDFLEYAHMWAPYEGSNQLKALKTLVRYCKLPIPQVDALVATPSTTKFTMSTPAFNAVLV